LVGELAAWHVAFLVVGLPGVALALWVRTLREPARRGLAAGAPAEVPLGEVLAFLRGHWTLFAGHFLGFSLLALTFNAVAFWMPPYLQRVHGLTPGEFGTPFGLILAIAGAAGILAGGVLADRLRRRGLDDAELWPGIVSALAIWPLGVLTTQAADGWTSLAWFAAFMFASSFPFAAAASGLQAVAPNRLRGQVSALYLFAINLAGIGLGTFLTGFFNDYVYADESRVGDSLAWIVSLGAPLSALLLFLARRPYAARSRLLTP
jgi:MFS family permease